MIRQRTTPILVIAILHLAGAGFGLFTSLCACGGLVMMESNISIMPTPPSFPARPGQPAPPPLPPNPNDLLKYLIANVPGYHAFIIVGLGISFLLDVMLLSAGIGLLKMQPWALRLSLVYASISIIFRIVSFVYQIVWTLSATQAFYDKFAPASPFSSLMTISSGIGAVGTLLVILYPLAVIIVLLLPSTGAAFRSEIPARDDGWEDGEEEDDDDWWRDPPPRSDKIRR